MLNKQVTLSILLVTYNHEKYIRQALSNLFKQIFDGPIELIVADDRSTDSTLSIIKEHEGIDTRFQFKYLIESKNLGITKNYKRGFEACTGEYIAVLEGDDYWINPRKLQRQVDFLKEHWESNVCSVNYYIFEEESARLSPRLAPSAGHRFISARELIADNIVGNFSTCVYRRSALSMLPDTLFDLKSYDWITNITLSRNSLIGFLEEPMSVYRLHSEGIWTQTSNIDKLKAQLEVLPAYDALTDHVFHEDFERLSSHLRHVISISQLGHTAESVGKPFIRSIPTLLRYTPPIFIIIIKLLLPEAIKNLFSRVIKRSRSI